MEHVLVSPPLAFGIILAVTLALSIAMKRLRLRKGGYASGFTKSYACGEDVGPSNTVQPNYKMFFPFAFFFTILHVVALTVATAPTDSGAIFAIACVYIAGVVVGLSVLFSR